MLGKMKMKRQPDNVTRRAFCAATGSGLLAIGLVGCDSSSFPPDAQSDLAGGTDASSFSDLGGAANCPTSNVINAGPASAIAMNQAKAVTISGTKYYVCNGPTGLYGLSSICTHQGCAVTFESQKTEFYCGCHGAVFSFDGVNTISPVHNKLQPLQKLTVCLDSNGDAILSTG